VARWGSLVCGQALPDTVDGQVSVSHLDGSVEGGLELPQRLRALHNLRVLSSGERRAVASHPQLPHRALRGLQAYRVAIAPAPAAGVRVRAVGQALVAKRGGLREEEWLAKRVEEDVRWLLRRRKCLRSGVQRDDARGGVYEPPIVWSFRSGQSSRGGGLLRSVLLGEWVILLGNDAWVPNHPWESHWPPPQRDGAGLEVGNERQLRRSRRREGNRRVGHHADLAPWLCACRQQLLHHLCVAIERGFEERQALLGEGRAELAARTAQSKHMRRPQQVQARPRELVAPGSEHAASDGARLPALG